MPVVWSERHRGHAPDGGYWLGVRIPGDEEPERGDTLRAALVEAGAKVREPERADAGLLASVHDPEFLEFLEHAHERWVAAGHVDDPGQPLVVPYVFALPQVGVDERCRHTDAIRAEVGRFAMDTMTLIGPGTWDAARAAVDAAVTAADLVLGGAPAAYAAVRPPGHHAGRALFGGSCYLNNAACAAQRLRDGGIARVAVLDLDAHHGNGTQAIFYDRADVLYASVHVDPGAGWFPYFTGFGDECGAGGGAGANFNLPLAPGSADSEWCAAVASLVRQLGGLGVDAVVVSLGVDAAAADPESPLAVTLEGFAAAGRLVAELDRPAVFVQEGGYDLQRLGGLVLAVLCSFEEHGGPRA
jgi:acetoin utilization deacetylase AcuC-like enzyme